MARKTLIFRLWCIVHYWSNPGIHPRSKYAYQSFCPLTSAIEPSHPQTTVHRPCSVSRSATVEVNKKWHEAASASAASTTSASASTKDDNVTISKLNLILLKYEHIYFTDACLRRLALTFLSHTQSLTIGYLYRREYSLYTAPSLFRWRSRRVLTCHVFIFSAAVVCWLLLNLICPMQGDQKSARRDIVIWNLFLVTFIWYVATFPLSFSLVASLWYRI